MGIIIWFLLEFMIQTRSKLAPWNIIIFGRFLFRYRTLFTYYFALSCNCVNIMTSCLSSLLIFMGFSMSRCEYGYLISRMTTLTSLRLLNFFSIYCFTLVWKVLNWSFMLQFLATVSSTSPNDGTSPVKFSRTLFTGWLFLLLPLLWFLILLFLVFTLMDVAVLVFE